MLGVNSLKFLYTTPPPSLYLLSPLHYNILVAQPSFLPASWSRDALCRQASSDDTSVQKNTTTVEECVESSPRLNGQDRESDGERERGGSISEKKSVRKLREKNMWFSHCFSTTKPARISAHHARFRDCSRSTHFILSAVSLSALPLCVYLSPTLSQTQSRGER